MLKLKFPPGTTSVSEAMKDNCRLCFKAIGKDAKKYSIFRGRIHGILIHRLIFRYFDVNLNPDHGQEMCAGCLKSIAETKKFADTIAKANTSIMISLEEQLPELIDKNEQVVDFGLTDFQIEFAGVPDTKVIPDIKEEMDSSPEMDCDSESVDAPGTSKKSPAKRRSCRCSEVLEILNKLQGDVKEIKYSVTGAQKNEVAKLKARFPFALPLRTIEQAEACEKFLDSPKNWADLKTYLKCVVVNGGKNTSEKETVFKILFHDDLFSKIAFTVGPHDKKNKLNVITWRLFSSFLQDYLNTPATGTGITRYAVKVRKRLVYRAKKQNELAKDLEMMEERIDDSEDDDSNFYS